MCVCRYIYKKRAFNIAHLNKGSLNSDTKGLSLLKFSRCEVSDGPLAEHSGTNVITDLGPRLGYKLHGKKTPKYNSYLMINNVFFIITTNSSYGHITIIRSDQIFKMSMHPIYNVLQQSITHTEKLSKFINTKTSVFFH